MHLNKWVPYHIVGWHFVMFVLEVLARLCNNNHIKSDFNPSPNLNLTANPNHKIRPKTLFLFHEILQ